MGESLERYTGETLLLFEPCATSIVASSIVAGACLVALGFVSIAIAHIIDYTQRRD